MIRMLAIDIECAPALAWTYGLWNVNIGIGQIEKPPEIIGWAYRWYGEPAKTCKYTWAEAEGAYEDLWAQLDEATHVLHFNGTSFDMPWINHEIEKRKVNGGRPPSPYKQIDLMRQAKKNFRSISNKLQFLSTDLLGLEGKVGESALDLFLAIYRGDEKKRAAAEKRMERYCKQDVNLLPKMYDAMLPWLTGINANLYTGDPSEEGCPNCGSRKHLQKRGSSTTGAGMYQRYHCQKCGTWSKGRRGLAFSETRNDR